MTNTSIPCVIGRAKTVVATPTGLKVGTKGKVQPAGEVLAMLTKSDARKLRRQLRASGFPGHAAARRAA